MPARREAEVLAGLLKHSGEYDQVMKWLPARAFAPGPRREIYDALRAVVRTGAPSTHSPSPGSCACAKPPKQPRASARRPRPAEVPPPLERPGVRPDRLSSAKRLSRQEFRGRRILRRCESTTDTSAPGYFRMLTARATISATVTMEMTDCRAMASLAQRDSGITSVGLNADALVNAR